MKQKTSLAVDGIATKKGTTFLHLINILSRCLLTIDVLKGMQTDSHIWLLINFFLVDGCKVLKAIMPNLRTLK